MTTPRLARRRVVHTGLATAALTPWQRTAQPAAAATPDRTFTVATFNVRAGQPTRVYAESLRALMSRAALIGLQETHSPKFARALRRVLAEPRFAGWSAYRPTTPEVASTNTILWGPGFEVQHDGHGAPITRSVLACAATPPLNAARSLQWVRLTDTVTGRTLTLLNTHLNHGIQRGDGCPWFEPEHTASTRAAFRHLAAIADRAAAAAKHGQVIATVDANIDHPDDQKCTRPSAAKFPWRTLEEQDGPRPHLVSHYTAVGGGPTHGADRYDYVYLWDRRPRHRVLTLRATSRLTGLSSDHDAVVVRFRMRGRAS